MFKFPKYIDTHVHLHHGVYEGDEERIVNQALEKGVWLILLGTDFESSVRAIETASKYPFGVYAAIGVHPKVVLDTYNDNFTSNPDDFGVLKDFQNLAKNQKVVAIGEVGLDFENYYFSDSDFELDKEMLVYLQDELLKRFLGIASENRFPTILSVRGAHNEALDHLNNINKKNNPEHARGIVHHFTDDWNMASKYIKLNFSPSITNLLTRSFTRHSVIKDIPIGNLVVESECPYLFSHETNSSRVEPADLPSVFEHVSSIKKIPHEEMSRNITRNALRIFPKIIRDMP